MDANFLDGGEVDVRTVSYDNPEETTFASHEVRETTYLKVSRWFLMAGVLLLPLFFLRSPLRLRRRQSPKRSLPQKRQLMNAMLGDYRAAMQREEAALARRSVALWDVG